MGSKVGSRPARFCASESFSAAGIRLRAIASGTEDDMRHTELRAHLRNRGALHLHQVRIELAPHIRDLCVRDTEQVAGRDAVRGIAAISMVEALVPAAGPVLGAALLVYLSWRGTFWILAGAALVVLPIVARITPWCGFCCFLAVRGPPAISDALHLPTAQMGRASAVMVLAFLIAAALGTQLIAPLLDRPSVLPMAVGMLLFTVGSAALITPYPERVAAHDPPKTS